MTDYKKLIEALRCEGMSKRCDTCTYGYRLCPDSERNDACHVEQILDDAAAAIEDMANHITEMHERVTVLQIARGKLEEEVDALKHDIARAIQNNVNLLSEFQQIGAENMMLKAKMEVQDGQ